MIPNSKFDYTNENDFINRENRRVVPLRDRKHLIVDYATVSEESYDKVKGHKWYRIKGQSNKDSYYAASHIKQLDGTVKNIKMHTFLLGKKDGHIIDHINNDGLNNLLSNIRFVTPSQNSRNRRKSDKRASKYYGVSKYEDKSKYKDDEKYNWVTVCSNVKLGYYKYEIHAAYAYDAYVKENKLDEYMKINGIDKPIDFIEYTKKIKFGGYEKGIHYSHTKRKFVVKIENIYGGMFDNHDEAKKKLDEMIDDIEKKKKDALKARMSEEIVRNSDGLAIIKSSNKSTDIIVDDKNWHNLRELAYWYENRSGYAAGLINGTLTLMHRYVMREELDKDKNLIIDHRNRNKMDNRKSNLRATKRTDSINTYNKSKSQNGTTKYVGISIDSNGKYRVQISRYGKSPYVGTYDTEKEALEKLNKRALELYGEDANIQYQSNKSGDMTMENVDTDDEILHNDKKIKLS